MMLQTLALHATVIIDVVEREAIYVHHGAAMPATAKLTLRAIVGEHKTLVRLLVPTFP
jgi:hypothetical protein